MFLHQIDFRLGKCEEALENDLLRRNHGPAADSGRSRSQTRGAQSQTALGQTFFHGSKNGFQFLPAFAGGKSLGRDFFEQTGYSLMKAAELADRGESRGTQPLQRVGAIKMCRSARDAGFPTSQESSNCASVPTRVGRTGKPDRASSCRRCSRHRGCGNQQMGTGNRAELFQRGAGFSRGRRTGKQEIQIPL